MKNKTFLTFVLVLATSITFGQLLKESSLIGTWYVVSIDGGIAKMSQQKDEKKEELIKVFKGATFSFKEDQSFSFISDFEDLKGTMQNASWKYDLSNNKILIREWMDKKSSQPRLMEISVVKEDDKIYFRLKKSQLVLEVRKWKQQ